MRGAARTDIPPTMRDERAGLRTLLDYTRQTAIAKADGLTDEQAHAAPLPQSPVMTVAAVITHLRWVEWSWVHEDLLGEPPVGGAADPRRNGSFLVAEGRPIADVVAEYAAASRELDVILAGMDLDDEGVTVLEGQAITVRWVYLHLIEETARHNGHLDAMRELIDGTTGS